MRVRLTTAKLKILFNDSQIIVSDFCKDNNISIRSFNNWRNGSTTIPGDIFKTLVIATKIEEKKLQPLYLNDYWHIPKAAKKGGEAVKKKYGNFGTTEGRSKGGLKSILSHQKLKDNFKHIKTIKIPSESELLAELLGILIGDGGMSKYQIIMTTNSITDIDHAIL